MEEAIIAILLADSGVVGYFSDRINFVKRPPANSSFPACTLRRITGERQYSTEAPVGLVSANLQIDVWGESYSSAKLSSRTILSALDGYKGGVIQGVFFDGERDSQDESSQSSTHLYKVTFDVLVWHTE